MNATTKTIFSARWDMLKADTKKLAIGFALGLAGAVCTYLETNFIGDLRQILADYLKPEYLPLILGFITAVNSTAINTLRKWLSNTTYIDQQ